MKEANKKTLIKKLKETITDITIKQKKCRKDGDLAMLHSWEGSKEVYINMLKEIRNW